MNPREFCALAGRLMQHPAVPYFEHEVREEVARICQQHGLEWRRDQFGNMIMPLKRGAGRPLVLAAHMDHPGFQMVRRLSSRRWLARFCGGVPEQYFLPGIALRVMPGSLPARLGPRRPGKDRLFEIELSSQHDRAAFAVWELEDFGVRNGRIYGRACDDLVGVATILGTMIELKGSRPAAHVIGVISRAEEIGFHGALAVAGANALPKASLVISLETSRELPGVEMGGGVIIRVGDRTSVFDSEATRFLTEVAAGMGKRNSRFLFQRALMSGGTCEATAYQEFGFQTAAVCVALGNYHNCADGWRIQQEYIDVADACGMVDLLVAVAKQGRQYRRLTARLPARLEKMRRAALKRLRETADTPDSD